MTSNTSLMRSLALVTKSSSSDHSSDTTGRRLRSAGLTCQVCGASAIGFNFSIITCACCKAFFRRNALYGLDSYQCRYSTQECPVNLTTRRDCSYCRLKKCFEMGMKKELILSEHAKRLKREKIVANRQLTITTIQRKSDLTADESIYLRNISNIYEEYCRTPIIAFDQHEYEIACRQPVKTRIKLQHYLEAFQTHQTSLHNFFHHIPEFQQFVDSEQKLLLEHNVRLRIRLNLIETIDDACPLGGAANLPLETLYGRSLVETIDQCLRQFRYHLDDSRCTQLILILLLFSTTVKYKGNLDALVLFRIQEKYTVLLWSYLKHRYGEPAACLKFALAIRYCLQLQKISHIMETKVPDIPLEEVLLATQQMTIN